MTTTPLFIETLIGGILTSIWLLIIPFIIFGNGWFNLKTEELLNIIVIIAISYPVGVIFEEIWKLIIDKKLNDIKSKYFKKDSTRLLEKTRFKIFNGDGKMIMFFDHMRSRMRISRNIFFNLYFITLLSFFYIVFRVNVEYIGKLHLLFFVAIFGGILTFVAFYSWKKISESYYKKIKQYSEK